MLDELIKADNKPLGEIPTKPTPEKPSEESPGLFRTAVEEFKEYSLHINAAKTVINRWEEDYLERKEGWDKHNWEDFKDYKVGDWLTIDEADYSPEQRALVQQRIKDEYAHDEWMARGGWVGKLVGGAAGFISSSLGLKWFASLGNPRTFAAISKGNTFVNNVANAVPGFAAQSAIINTARYNAKETMDLTDWFADTAADTIFGATFFGAMGIKGAVDLKGRLGNLKSGFQGVEFVAETDAKGSFKTWTAVAGDKSAGAAEVIEAQKFIDNGLDVYGSSPWFIKTFNASPVVKMMTSQFAAVRDFGQAIFRPSNILRMNSATSEGVQSAEQIASGLMRSAGNMKAMLAQSWESYAGINSNLPFKDTVAAFKKIASEPGYMGRIEFNQEVAYAMRRGDKQFLRPGRDTPIPQIEQAATEMRKHFGYLYDEAVKLELFPADLDPITAISYLNRLYNKKRMEVDGRNFKKAVTTELLEQSQAIKELNAPLDQLLSHRQHLREIKKSLRSHHERVKAGMTEVVPHGENKGYDVLAEKSMFRESFDKSHAELKLVNTQIAAAKADLEARILDGTIDPMLVSSRPHFTKKEALEFEAIREPFMKRKESIKSSIEVSSK